MYRFRRLRTRALVTLAVGAATVTTGTAAPAHAACGFYWSLPPTIHTNLSVAGVAEFYVGGIVGVPNSCGVVVLNITAAPVGGATPVTCWPFPSLVSVFGGGGDSFATCAGTAAVGLVGTSMLITWTVAGAGVDASVVHGVGTCSVTIPAAGNASC